MVQIFEDLMTRSIYGIGQNYHDHIKEMGAQVPTEPVIFLKPASSLLESPSQIALPSISKNVHYEAELVLKLGEDLNVSEVAIGLDLTARDLQSEAKKKGLPWSISKGFAGSAVVGNFFKIPKNMKLSSLALELSINHKVRQKGPTSDMIFDCAELLRYLSGIFNLESGDLIYTGTPSGVGQLNRGDVINAKLLHNEDIVSTLDTKIV